MELGSLIQTWRYIYSNACFFFDSVLRVNVIKEYAGLAEEKIKEFNLKPGTLKTGC
jgi:hypothetical protein